MRRYVITGFDAEGRSSYYRRNVAEDCVLDLIQEARADGWTGVTSSVESF